MQVVGQGGDSRKALTGEKGKMKEKGKKAILGMLMSKLLLWAIRTQSHQRPLRDWLELTFLKSYHQRGKEAGVLTPTSYPSSVEVFSPGA